MDFSEHKGIYVIGALANGKIQKVTGELTGEARVLADQLGEEVAVVLIGADLKDPASSLIPLGADKVYVIDHPLLAHYDGKAYQKALAPFLLEKKPDTIIFGATPFGRDLAPRLAAELVCGVTADVTELSADTEKGLVIWSRPAMDGQTSCLRTIVLRSARSARASSSTRKPMLPARARSSPSPFPLKRRISARC